LNGGKQAGVICQFATIAIYPKAFALKTHLAL
jgi:hypothetical protein